MTTGTTRMRTRRRSSHRARSRMPPKRRTRMMAFAIAKSVSRIGRGSMQTILSRRKSRLQPWLPLPLWLLRRSRLCLHHSRSRSLSRSLSSLSSLSSRRLLLRFTFGMLGSKRCWSGCSWCGLHAARTSRLRLRLRLRLQLKLQLQLFRSRLQQAQSMPQKRLR